MIGRGSTVPAGKETANFGIGRSRGTTVPRDGDGGRRIGVARCLERSGAFGQCTDEGTDMRVARAIRVDGIDRKTWDCF